ncbi:MAG: protein kinase [Pyrinomonadaceae bacterium]|nr:protein kinase [Pyrinomonadaceae bacterium]
MQPQNWDKIKDILDEALRLDAAGRASYLDKAGLAADVRGEVESLMSFDEASANLMQLSAVEFSSSFIDGREADDRLAGQQIGHYRVVSEIGHGGMGAVYLAEREDGTFSQRVALKLLKREMNTAALRRRFEQERDILSRLEHPNIARLLDAGATDDKIPFLAMEYVEGRPIDEYCNKNGLDLDARLELFQQICSTVDFAHRNLIVHRDLKPSNILVTEDGIPKLLDFGISKILSDTNDESPAATVTRLGAMTPGYASPEQLRSESVTTSTDVYSLGVILFELLSGHRPFEAKESNLNDILNAVIETDPPLPSSVAGTLPERSLEAFTARPDDIQAVNETRQQSHRLTAPRMMSVKPQYLRGDLDNIILKALKKEPERRYLSPENFSDDIRRYQDGLPVTARPDTLVYRAGKFVRRNRYAAIAAALVLIAIIAGAIATLWQARVAHAERLRAESRFNDVRKLANSYIFDVYPEIENLEGSLKAREKILVNALGYLDSLSKEAGDDLELQGELATAYEKIGDVQGALTNSSLGNIQAGLDSYTKAAKLREAVYLADSSDLDAKEKLAANYYTTARTLWNNSQTQEATEAFERSLKLRRELVASRPSSVEYQNRLAVVLIDYGAIPVFNSQTAQALVLFDEALAIVEKLRGQDPENADFKKTQTRLLRVMSKAKGSIGDYEGGIRGFAVAAEISRELAAQFPDDFRVQRSVWLTDSLTCELYIDKEDAHKGVETCLPTIAFPKAALAKEPENGVIAYDLAISHFNTARAYRFAGDYSNVIAQADKAIAVMTALSKKTPENLEYQRNLAVYETERVRAHLKLGRYAEAQTGAQKVLTTMIPIAEADKATTTYRYDVAIAYRLSAEAFARTGSKAKAVENMQKAISIVEGLRDENALRDTDKDLLTELANELAEYSS